MSKDQRSRALLRNLRKQARKGTLSAREKKQLLSQEEKFRKARRSTAKSVGRGLLGAGALLATPAGRQMLEGAKKSRADRKVDKAEKRSEKETEKLENLARRKEEKRGVRMAEGIDRAEEAEREEDRQKLLARADEFEKRERDRVTAPVTDVDFSMGEEGPTRSDFDAYQRQRAKELGSQVMTPEEQQMRRFGNRTAVQALKGERSNLLPGDTDYTGGFETTGESSLFFPAGPINEPAFSADDLMIPEPVRQQASSAGPRAEPDRPVMTRQGMDLATMIAMQGRVPEEYRGVFERMSDRERAQMAREAARMRNEQRRQGESGIPFADQAGPRVQEDGGKVEYGIGGAILAGVNAIRNKEGLAGIKNVVKAAATPGSGVAQGAKLAGGLLAGSKNPAFAGLGKFAGLASNFLPGGGGPKGALGALGSLAGGAGGAAGGALGALGALGGVAGLFGGQSAEKGMKVADMRDGGRAAHLKKMIAKKYGFR